MIKTPPSRLQVATIVGFVALCLAVLLFLWIDFGGSTPLAARGYRVQVAFSQANELATGADVRVAGVDVGKVVALRPELNDSRTLATLQIKHQYVPLPSNARATLRIKTLLGETYVQLGWGARGVALRDGGRLPDGQVAQTVAIDQILSTFDPRTRQAFRTWMQAQAGAVTGRGVDINATFAQLPGFFTTTDKLSADLDHQTRALSSLVANTGSFFSAISARQGQLSGLITGADRLFATTAQRNRALAQLFEALPGFEAESRRTLPALTAFANRADPVVRHLQPLAPQLTDTFDRTGALAPDLRTLLARVGPVEQASRQGLPALDTVLQRIPPLTGAFIPFLRNANPIVSYIAKYTPEIDGFFGNVAAATEGANTQAPGPAHGQVLHFLRASQTMSPSTLSFGAGALSSSRNNAYRAPGTLAQIAQGLGVLNPAQCSGPTPAPPAAASPTGLTDLIAKYVYRADASGAVPAPACRAAGNVPGFSTRFPQLRAEPPLARR